MTADAPDARRDERAAALFTEALKREPREREAWLRDVVAGDEALLAEVRSLLAREGSPGDATGRAGEGRAHASPGSDARATPSLPAGHPTHVGRYRIVSLLGEGGMGAVYEAEQAVPRRRVALKVLRIALASDEARRRFAQEGELLGRLRHPAVAQVYEMGTAALAVGIEVPYLAMEHVRGARTLTQFVREVEPGREALLDLFCHIVDGVEHAHQQGIVHRDLKPANIIVDVDGRPKVIDFGLARAMGEDGDLLSMHTRTGQVMGTPTYMSPEQFEGRPERIGLATDIYSLGVLLFELISSRLPHDLDGLSIAEIAQAVRERPPRKLSDSTKTRLRDDLDTIVGKALEKEPERRYETAAALAADVRRYLRQEPILARPASAMHRTMLFARRHRLLVGSFAAVLLVSIAAAVVSLRFAFDARRRADEADWAAYRAQILGAAQAIEGQHLIEASELLAATPAHLRGWEYRHLASRVDRTLPSPWPSAAGLHGIRSTADSTRGVVTRRRSDGGMEQVVVDLETRTERLVLPVGAVGVAELSADGEQLALAERAPDGRLATTVWNVAKGRLTSVAAPMEQNDPAWTTVVWHPSGDRYLLSTAQGFGVYAAGTGAQLGSSDGLRCSATWTGDGRWIVALASGVEGAGNRYAAYLLDAESLERRPGFVPLVTSGRLLSSPSGALVAVMSESGPVILLEVLDGGLTLARKLVTSGEASGACAWSPDGRLLAGGMQDGHIQVWDAATGAVQHAFSAGRVDRSSSMAELAFLPEGGDLLSVSRSGETRVWPVGSGTPEVFTAHTSYVYPVSLSADGSLLLSGGWDGNLGDPGAVKLWDARTGVLVAEYGQIGERCEAGALTPDGRHALVGVVGGARPSWRLEAIDLLEGRVRTLVEPMQGGTFALHPDGRRLLQGTNLWDLLTGERLTSSPPRRDLGAFSPDGRRMATWHEKRDQVRIEELASGIEVCRWSDADKGGCWGSTFSPDSRWLVSPWIDGSVTIRDAASGRLVAELPDTGAEVIVASVSPDGTRIATGGRDNIVRMWDTTHFQLVAQLSGHTRYVFSLAWSADGERLYSGSGDGTVRLWDTRPLAELVAAKRAREAAMPDIERRVGRALADSSDPQGALEALLTAEDLDARGSELVAQAAIAFLVPRAEAEYCRGSESSSVSSPSHGMPRGPRWLRAPRAAAPPVIDGVLDDPAWAFAPWTDAFVDIEGPVKPTPRFATRGRVLWDDEYLYVAASLEEPHVWGTLARRDDIVFNDNDFEVFVDPEGDGRWYGEIEVNALGTLFDLRLSRAYREHGQADHGWSSPGLRAAVAVDGTLNDASDTDRAWTVEIAIPYAALADHGTTSLPPKPGDVWRVNFSRVEWQHDIVDGRYVRRPDTREDNWVWTPQFAVDMHRPVQWGFVELVGGDG